MAGFHGHLRDSFIDLFSSMPDQGFMISSPHPCFLFEKLSGLPLALQPYAISIVHFESLLCKAYASAQTFLMLAVR